MLLILKRMSPSTLIPDIEVFVAPALKGGLFAKPGKVENITVQTLKENKTAITEFNALIRVKPIAAGKRIIKLLNRKALNGKPINISEFHFRLRDNDRRIQGNLHSDDRRRRDRRRMGLAITDITELRKKAPSHETVQGWNTDITL